MSPQDVQDKVEQFLALMRQEQELKLELASLDLCITTKAQAEKNLARERALVGAILDLRRQKMLPIVAQMAAFVGGRLESVTGAIRG